MTEPDFAMGTSLVAGTARGLAPLPAFLLGAEAVPLLWVGDGKVASPSLEGGQVAVLRLHAASAGHVTKPAYSCVRGMYVRCGTKVVRVPRKLRTSEKTYSTQYGAYCRQQQAHVQEGGSMPTRDKRLLTDLRCRKHDHPFKAEIWQRLHYVAHSNEIVGKTTPKGALDNVRCPICGSPAKEP